MCSAGLELFPTGLFITISITVRSGIFIVEPELLHAWLDCPGGTTEEYAPAHGYAWVFVGQFLGGIGQPFFTNIPARLAGEW